MKFGCCTSIENYDLVEACGFDRIILPGLAIFAMDEPAFADTSRKIAGGALECRGLNSFCSPQLVLCGTAYDEKAVLTYIQALAARAAKLGVTQIGIGSPMSRTISPEFSREKAMLQFMRSLTLMCNVCGPYGIDILLEAVCDLECNIVTTTNEARTIVEMLQIENLQLVFDTYHAYMMKEDNLPLRRAMPYVKLVHVAQNIENQRHYLRAANIDEYRVFTDVLLDAGYDGEISVEAFSDITGDQLDQTLVILRSLTTR
jgi:sugar phosphate isomerase/epimerase